MVVSGRSLTSAVQKTTPAAEFHRKVPPVRPLATPCYPALQTKGAGSPPAFPGISSRSPSDSADSAWPRRRSAVSPSIARCWTHLWRSRAEVWNHTSPDLARERDNGRCFGSQGHSKYLWAHYSASASIPRMVLENVLLWVSILDQRFADQCMSWIDASLSAVGKPPGEHSCGCGEIGEGHRLVWVVTAVCIPDEEHRARHSGSRKCGGIM